MATATGHFSMYILKKKRKSMRPAFERTYNALNEAGSNWNPANKDDSKVWAYLGLLREKADELAKLDEEVMNLVLQEEAGEEDLDKVIQSADEYASKYKRISLYVRKRVSAAIKVEEDSNSILHVSKRKFQLPTLEYKKFGGDVKEWLTFCGQFKKIDEDPEMDDADKFEYLLQATTPKTRAREVVESFPPIGSNYSRAMECLKARFGREELLVEFYVRDFLNLTLVMNSKEGRVPLSSLYDRIETQLRAKKMLGWLLTSTQPCCSRW
jgi:DNA polymerase I-like protein with 3'-5' exonuclease and polymerase domains